VQQLNLQEAENRTITHKNILPNKLVKFRGISLEALLPYIPVNIAPNLPKEKITLKSNLSYCNEWGPV